MAWTYTQNFNALNTADLNGQDSWSGSTNFDVSAAAAAIYEGAKGVSCAGGGVANQIISRAITAITAGTVYVAIKHASGNTNEIYIELYEGASGKMHILYDADVSKIQIYDNGIGDYVDVATGLSDNTWYPLKIEFNDSTQPEKYQLTVNISGSWGTPSGWKTVNGGSYTEIDEIKFNVQKNVTTAYFDTITPTDPTMTAYSVSLTESVGVVDLSSKRSFFGKTLTELLTLVPSLAAIRIKRYIVALTDAIKLPHIITLIHKGWVRLTKHSTNWTSQSENSTTWNNQRKNQ